MDGYEWIMKQCDITLAEMIDYLNHIGARPQMSFQGEITGPSYYLRVMTELNLFSFVIFYRSANVLTLIEHGKIHDSWYDLGPELGDLISLRYEWLDLLE